MYPYATAEAEYDRRIDEGGVMIAMPTETEQPARPRNGLTTGRRPAFAPLAPDFSLHIVPELDASRVKEFQTIAGRLPLLDGARITPDPHRPGFYDLELAGGVYFFYVYPSRRRVILLAVWFNDPGVS